MKKSLLILIFILNVVFVNAQVLITPVDFSNSNPVAYRLEDGDGISFIIKDKEYVISIDEIGKSSVRLKSFFYNNDQRETFYMPLGFKYSYKLDFDKNNIYDLKINLAEVENNTAVILFERIYEKKENKITSKTTYNNPFNLKGIIITILIILAGLVAYFTFRKK